MSGEWNNLLIVVLSPTPVEKTRESSRAPTLPIQPATSPQDWLPLPKVQSFQAWLDPTRAFIMALYSQGYKTGSEITRASYNVIKKKKNAMHFIASHIS